MIKTGPRAEFNEQDYYSLSKNSFKRFKAYEPYVSYAIFSANTERMADPVAHQFIFPKLSDINLPSVIDLKQIEFCEGNTIRAINMNDQEMTAHKSIRFSVKDPEKNSLTYYTLFLFLPASKETDLYRLLWKSEPCLHDYKYLTSKSEIRGGKIDIKNKKSNLNLRQFESLRSKINEFPTPNNAMGGTAADAYKFFFERNDGFLNLIKNNLIKSWFKYSHHSFNQLEWCHALGKQFFLRHANSNVLANLGAAPSWFNSQMMIFEEAFKWHYKTYPDANVELKSEFLMFDNSDVICSGEMEVSVVINGRAVSMNQKLQAQQSTPIYPHATDKAIATFVLNSLLLCKPFKDVVCKNLQVPYKSIELSQDDKFIASLNHPSVNFAKDNIVSLIERDKAITFSDLSLKRFAPVEFYHDEFDDDELNIFFDDFSRKKIKHDNINDERDVVESNASIINEFSDEELNEIFDKYESVMSCHKKCRVGM